MMMVVDYDNQDDILREKKKQDFFSNAFNGLASGMDSMPMFDGMQVDMNKTMHNSFLQYPGINSNIDPPIRPPAWPAPDNDHHLDANSSDEEEKQHHML